MNEQELNLIKIIKSIMEEDFGCLIPKETRMENFGKILADRYNEKYPSMNINEVKKIIAEV